MQEAVMQYYSCIEKDKNHRYRSWEHCYAAFGDQSLSDDILSLHLAFYLASWGMYRGSAGLLSKDYKIHLGAVRILKNFHNVTRSAEHKLTPKLEDIFCCMSELKKFYGGIGYMKDEMPLMISATDTLVTKIMLGATGSVPAFDTNFLNGIRNENIIEGTSCTESNIKKLYNYASENENEKEILDCQEQIRKNSKVWYPPMKIVDMYFFKKGINSLGLV